MPLVAVGQEAGQTNQGSNGVALGYQAGHINQYVGAVAIGYQSGYIIQGDYNVAVGTNAGSDSDGIYAVAIGTLAGSSSQKLNAVAIGSNAGGSKQGSNTVAIGTLAGNSSQGSNAIAIGYKAATTNQHTSTIVLNASGVDLPTAQPSSFYVSPIRSLTGPSLLYYNNSTKEVTYGDVPSILSLTGSATNFGDYLYWNASTSQWTVGSSNITLGANAGSVNQGSSAVAVGSNAGRINQGTGAVALGLNAGSTGQGPCGIAIGANAGAVNQGSNSVAIGCTAGYSNQSVNAVAVGPLSGSFSQGTGSVAIGWQAGFTGQGLYSVAIGPNAGYTGQSPYSIALNATEQQLNPGTTGFFVNPIRSTTGPSYMYYNSTTSEITSSSYFIGAGTTVVSTTATVPSATWSGNQLVLVNSMTGPVTVYLPTPLYDNSICTVRMLYKRQDPVTIITLNPTGTTYLDANVSERQFIYSNGVWQQIGDIDYTNFYPTTLYQSITGITGTSVAISNDGNVIAAGFTGDTSPFANVYQRSSTTSLYTFTQTFSGSNSSGFGSAVALSGDGNVFAVGQNLAAPPKVDVYSRPTPSSTYSLFQSFTGPNSSRFGSSISFSADAYTMAVGAPGVSTTGGFYIYNKTTASTPYVGQGSNFPTIAQIGTSISLSADGNTLGSGAPTASRIGIYVRSGGTWNFAAQGDFTTSNAMGRSVSLSADGNVMAAGAPTAPGFVNIYTRSGTTWSLQQQLSGTNDFGLSVGLSSDGNTLAVSSSSNNAVSVYTKSGPIWNTPAASTLSSIANASPVALSSDGNNLIVGSTRSNVFVYT